MTHRSARTSHEGVSLLPSDDAQSKEEIEDLCRLAVESSRAPDHLKTFLGVEIITASAQEEVAARVAVLQQHRDLEGHLVPFSGWSGIDLSGNDTDSWLGFKGGNAMQTFERMRSERKDRKKVGELAEHLSRPENNQLFIAGKPNVVADRLEQLIDSSGADGINLIQHLSPGTFEDFVDHIVPELQCRGRYCTASPDETLPFGS